VLDTVSRGRRELKRVAYLQVPAPAPGASVPARKRSPGAA